MYYATFGLDEVTKLGINAYNIQCFFGVYQEINIILLDPAPLSIRPPLDLVRSDLEISRIWVFWSF